MAGPVDPNFLNNLNHLYHPEEHHMVAPRKPFDLNASSKAEKTKKDFKKQKKKDKNGNDIDEEDEDEPEDKPLPRPMGL